ncbi:MAG TPA: nuclear transport factor 2 family protein [Thermoanaerobaculia bacterium]|nr:nuclear transport factor 2 family protein [Thermoanaerobaculia bacterium]
MKIQIQAGLRLVLATFVVAAAGCGAPQTEDPAMSAPTAPTDVSIETPELDRGSIGVTRDNYVAAVRDGNLEAMMGLWAEDGVLMPPDQPAVSGKDAIRAWYQNLLGSFVAEATLRSAETQIGAEWSFDRGTYTLTLRPKAAAPVTDTPEAPPAADGADAVNTAGPDPSAPPAPAARPAGPAQTITAKYLVVVRRGQGGNWKVARFIWNFDAPGQRPADATPATPAAPAAPARQP